MFTCLMDRSQTKILDLTVKRGTMKLHRLKDEQLVEASKTAHDIMLQVEHVNARSYVRSNQDKKAAWNVVRTTGRKGPHVYYVYGMIDVYD